MLLTINSFLFIMYCIRFTIKCCTIYSGNINKKTDVAIVILLLIICHHMYEFMYILAFYGLDNGFMYIYYVCTYVLDDAAFYKSTV